MIQSESQSGIGIAAIRQLTESTSITLAESIKQIAIATPLSSQPILTTYVQSGTGGTPLLLIHGFDSSVLEYRRLFPLLAEKHQTWAVDLLGFGFTNRPAGIKFGTAEIKTHRPGGHLILPLMPLVT